MTSPTGDIPRADTADVVRAALWMLGAALCFSAMAVGGRSVSFELDTFEIMMYRSLIGLTLVALIASATGAHRNITRRKPGLHLIRNVFHFTGQNLWFYAITVIPLAQVFAMEFTSPLWVLLLSPLLVCLLYVHLATNRGQLLSNLRGNRGRRRCKRDSQR